MKTSKFLYFLSFSFAFSLSTLTYAEVYKWVDENGKVHYSDKKSTSAKKLDVKKGESSLGKPNSNSTQRLNDQQKYIDYLESERQERQLKKQEKKQELTKRKQYCMQLQDQLKSYQEDRAIWYDLDENTGERRFLSEDELQENIREVQTEIDTKC